MPPRRYPYAPTPSFHDHLALTGLLVELVVEAVLAGLQRPNDEARLVPGRDHFLDLEVVALEFHHCLAVVRHLDHEALAGRSFDHRGLEHAIACGDLEHWEAVGKDRRRDSEAEKECKERLHGSERVELGRCGGRGSGSPDRAVGETIADADGVVNRNDFHSPAVRRVVASDHTATIASPAPISAMPSHSLPARRSPKIAIEATSAITGMAKMLSDASPAGSQRRISIQARKPAALEIAPT